MSDYTYSSMITTVVAPRVVYFPHFLMRPVETGVLLQARSPFFARMFSTWAKGVPARPWMNGLATMWGELKEAPPLQPDRLDLFNDANAMWDPNFNGWFNDDMPNIPWITSPKLATGLEFIVKSPISCNDLEDYFTSVHESIINLDRAFNPPHAEFSAVLSRSGGPDA